MNKHHRTACLRHLLVSTAFAICLAPELSAQEDQVTNTHTADVVIYGGTSAGVAAAVQVSRMGRSVILIEPGRHIGGLTSGGLGYTDSGDKRVIGGIAREFYQRIRRHYDSPAAWGHEKASELLSHVHEQRG